MSWEAWTKGAVDQGASGAAIYCPKSGAIWGQSGAITVDGSSGFCGIDKAGLERQPPPNVNGKKYMQITTTQSAKGGDIYIFKSGSCSLITHPGPMGGRVAVVGTDRKPQELISYVHHFENT